MGREGQKWLWKGRRTVGVGAERQGGGGEKSGAKHGDDIRKA